MITPIISICVFFLLILSPFSIAYSQSMTNQSTLNTDIIKNRNSDQHKINSNESKQYLVSVVDKFNISENSQKENEPGKITPKHMTVNVLDRLDRFASSFNQNTVTVLPQKLDIQPMTQRISNTERVRIEGKSTISKNVLLNEYDFYKIFLEFLPWSSFPQTAQLDLKEQSSDFIESTYGETISSISILNEQSYPFVGEKWQVKFVTTGIDDLQITAINGTTWFNGNKNPDLKFLNLSCGNQTRTYQWINGSIFIDDYICNEVGYETNKVLTSGKHHLEFKFGNDVGYANNLAFVPLTSDTVLLRDKGLSNISKKDTVSISESATITSSSFHPILVSDTVLLRDKGLPVLSTKDMVSISTSIANPNRIVSDTVLLRDTSLPDLSTKDTVSISEFITIIRIVSDTIPLSDTGLPDLSTKDTVSISESVIVNSFRPIFVSDSIAISESNTFTQTSFQPITISDTLEISESTNESSFRPVVVSDTLGLDEEVTLQSTGAQLSNSGSGGDNTPPSLVSNSNPFMINNQAMSFGDSTQITSTVETGQPISFTLKLEDNSGPQNIQHVEIYFDHQGRIIKNDLSETGIIYDRFSELKILDPNNLIQDASITVSQEKSFVIFTFDVVFSGEIKSSDVVFRAWDLERNSMSVYSPNALSVILTDTAKPSPTIPESNESFLMPELNGTTDELVVFLNAFDKWSGFSEYNMSDKDFLSHFGIKGEKIPDWFKDNNAKWFKQGFLTKEDLKFALINLHERGII